MARTWSKKKMVGTTIISVIVAGVGYVAITKWVWPTVKEDEDPASPSPTATAILPSLGQDDHPASLTSSSAESPPPPEERDDSTSLLSSSAESPLPPVKKHDVFLSFRGLDTRKGFTTFLYHELHDRGINTFMDEQKLLIGSSISQSLLTAIEESRFAVVVLSQNYASSTWCLDELTKIVECMHDEHRILPLFYEVEPSDVRNQKKSYEVDSIKLNLKSEQGREKLNRWRDALTKVGNLSGWNSKKSESERELVKKIVESVVTRLEPIESECAMSTEDFGSKRQAIDMVMKALKNDELTAVGVYGMEGVGKTNMVKHVGARVHKNKIFDRLIMAVVSQCPDVRKIQGSLAEHLGIKLEEGTEMERAASLNKEITRRSKILIILDDIWKILDLSKIGIPSYDKLKACKSKVILTTRRLQICHSMECQASISLNIVSWYSFLKKSSKSFESPSKTCPEASFHQTPRQVRSKQRRVAPRRFPTFRSAPELFPTADAAALGGKHHLKEPLRASPKKARASLAPESRSQVDVETKRGEVPFFCDDHIEVNSFGLLETPDGTLIQAPDNYVASNPRRRRCCNRNRRPKKRIPVHLIDISRKNSEH